MTERLGVKPPKEVFLLVHTETGEVGDAVLFELLDKYKEEGFEPVRYVLQQLKNKRARERTVDGVRERQCNKCQGWWPIAKMARAKPCHGGRRSQCRPRTNATKQRNRARKKLRDALGKATGNA